jgi:hypothetical protein
MQHRGLPEGARSASPCPVSPSGRGPDAAGDGGTRFCRMPATNIRRKVPLSRPRSAVGSRFRQAIDCESRIAFDCFATKAT